jgi:stage V sporulation protein S
LTFAEASLQRRNIFHGSASALRSRTQAKFYAGAKWHSLVPFKRVDAPKERSMVDIIKVAAKSRSTAVAGAIANVIREHKQAEVQAIGAGAVNQAVKAIAIARGYLKQDGLDIMCAPMFVEVDVEGQERTAIKFNVEAHNVPIPAAEPAEGERDSVPPREKPASSTE